MAKSKIEVKTPLFRGSYVHLTKGKKVVKEDGKEKIVFSILIPLKKGKPSTKTCLAEIEKMVAATTKEKFGASISKLKLKDYPVKDGDKMADEDEEKYEQFRGYWCINASSNYKPHTVDKHGETLEGEDEAYSGAWYKCKLSAWAWEYKKRRGVSFNIESAALLKDDTKFGGGSNAAKDFEDDIEESDGDEDADESEDGDDLC